MGSFGYLLALFRDKLLKIIEGVIDNLDNLCTKSGANQSVFA